MPMSPDDEVRELYRGVKAAGPVQSRWRPSRVLRSALLHVLRPGLMEILRGQHDLGRRIGDIERRLDALPPRHDPEEWAPEPPVETAAPRAESRPSDVAMPDPLAFMPVAARTYLERDASTIEGWLYPAAQWIFVIADKVQRWHGTTGDLVEIGLWDGRTFCLLAHLVRAGERARGFDIAIRPNLVANIARLGLAGRAVYSAMDTATLDAAGLAAATPAGIRMFHVDGGHGEAQTLHDLELAFAATRPDGIVVLDDFFSPTLPGVTAAAFRCFQEGRNAGFVPLVLAGQKCWFVQPEFADHYANEIGRLMPIRPVALPTPMRSLLGGTVMVYDLA